MNNDRVIACRRESTARMRLFCLPHAGAGASVFHGWASILPASIEVCPIYLPGRETRVDEPLPSSLAAIVGEVADSLGRYQDKPFAFFGHSMGGAIAFEIARELRRRAQRMPVRLLVSAVRAPHRRLLLPPLGDLDGKALLEGVERRYGPLPPEVRTTPEALQLLLPILRADLALIEPYCCVDEPPLACPISAFGGTADPVIQPDDLREWKRQTTGPFDLSLLPGGHFFVRDARAALLRAIESRLE